MSRKTDKYGDKSYINAEALLSFDGTDDSVNFGNVTLNDASDFTLEFIISLDDLIASSNTILEKADGNNRILITYNTVNNQVRFNLRDGSGNFQQIEINPSLGELFHFFCTYNATTSLFEIRSHYENVSETYAEGDFGNSGDLVVGANTAQDATFFNGNIGLFRIYDTVLTSSQELQVRKEPYAIPSALHANVTAENIPPRSYYKDTGNIYGKGTNAILWFDSVEQYNYAKGSPLTANHGVLTGWSDVEVVTTPEPTYVLDFYDESTSLNWTDDAGDTEIVTGIPPIEKAFSMDTYELRAEVANFGDLIGTGSYTFVVTARLNSGNSGTWITARLDGTRLNVEQSGSSYNTRNSGFSTSAVKDQIVTYIMDRQPFDGSNTGKTLYDLEEKGTANISPADYSGNKLDFAIVQLNEAYLIRVAVWDRLLSDRERRILLNNKNLGNPITTDGLLGYYIFNDNTAFVDGTDLKIRDYSGNDRHATCVDIAGADGAAKLANYQSALVDIKTLK